MRTDQAECTSVSVATDTPTRRKQYDAWTSSGEWRSFAEQLAREEAYSTYRTTTRRAFEDHLRDAFEDGLQSHLEDAFRAAGVTPHVAYRGDCGRWFRQFSGPELTLAGCEWMRTRDDDFLALFGADIEDPPVTPGDADAEVFLRGTRRTRGWLRLWEYGKGQRVDACLAQLAEARAVLHSTLASIDVLNLTPPSFEAFCAQLDWQARVAVVVEDALALSIHEALTLGLPLPAGALHTARLLDPQGRRPRLDPFIPGGGALVLVHGVSNSLKSVFLLSIAVALASGTPAFGFYAVQDGRPRRVRFISREDSREDIEERVFAMAAATGASMDLVHEHLVIDTPDKDGFFDVKGYFARLAAECDGEGTDVVIVDAWSRSTRVADREPHRYLPMLAKIKAWTEQTGLAVLMAVHDRTPHASELSTYPASANGKRRDDRLKRLRELSPDATMARMSGGSRMANMGAVVVGLTPVEPGQSALVRLERLRRNQHPVFGGDAFLLSLSLTRNADHWLTSMQMTRAEAAATTPANGRSVPARGSRDQQPRVAHGCHKVLTLLREHPEGEWTIAAVERHTGIKYQTGRRYLLSLERAGRVRRRADGTWEVSEVLGSSGHVDA